MRISKLLPYCLVAGILPGCEGESLKERYIRDDFKGAMMTTKTADGFTQTASGLKYLIEKEGAGDSPRRGQTVTVHYTGWLDENGQPGKKFDSSIDRGQPFQFVIGIGQVIRGWDEGVAMMKVGEKRRLIIPSSLGYGAHAVGGIIPANSTLIFDVELIRVD